MYLVSSHFHISGTSADYESSVASSPAYTLMESILTSKVITTVSQLRFVFTSIHM